jgi:predicted transcriptional regulator
MRAFAARLDDDVYDELKKRAESERKSMNAVLNESLDRHFRGRSDAKAALLRALAALDDGERSET